MHRRPPAPAPPRCPAPRRGTVLLVVLVLVGAVLALGVAFLHNAASAGRTTENAARAAAARRAARTGLTEALAWMSGPGWTDDAVPWERSGGRDVAADGPAGVLESDAVGTLRFRTRYETRAPASDAPRDVLDAALSLTVRATGTWDGADGGHAVHIATAVVRLAPRTGPPHAGGADDRARSPADLPVPVWSAAEGAAWADLARHAVVAVDARKGVSLDLPPQVRIAGDLWADDQPDWPQPGKKRIDYHAEHRRELLDSIGEIAPGAAGRPAGALAPWPAPLAGRATVREGTDADTADLLARLSAPAATTGGGAIPLPPAEPAAALAAGGLYRLFTGGPRYAPVALDDEVRAGEVLRLGPARDNPLGLFVRRGNVRWRGEATIAGTVLIDGELLLEDDARVRVRSVSWGEPPESGGAPWFAGSAAWPRLPAAVVADDLDVRDEGVRCEFVGGVICGGKLKIDAGSCRGGVPAWGDVTDVRPRGGDDLRVWLDVSNGAAPRFLDTLSAGGRAVRFGDGAVAWPIVAVNAGAGWVDLAGAARDPGAVDDARWSCDAPAGGRAHFRGPVAAECIEIEPPAAWGDLKNKHWGEAWERRGRRRGRPAAAVGRAARRPAAVGRDLERNGGRGHGPRPLPRRRPADLPHGHLHPRPAERRRPGRRPVRLRPAAVPPRPPPRRRPARRAALGAAWRGTSEAESEVRSAKSEVTDAGGEQRAPNTNRR